MADPNTPTLTGSTREGLILVVPVLALAAVGALLSMPPAKTAPLACEQPAVVATDPDVLVCDGHGQDARTRRWLAGKRLDLNQATPADLRRLPRVGQGLAERIAADREENGRYRTVDAVTRVDGMGPKGVERIAPLVFVGTD